MQRETNSLATGEVEMLNIEEHMKSKSMWQGSFSRLPCDWHIMGFDTKRCVVPMAHNHSPALFNMIKEIVVNAIDHHMSYPNAVKKILIRYDITDYTFEVYNDGPGIPIIIHEGATTKYGDKRGNRSIYVPEVVASIALAGTNMVKTPESIKGGVNGLGIKLVNYNSKKLTLETVYRGKKYTQVFRDGCDIIETPIIEEIDMSDGTLTENDKSDHTSIKYLPVYEKMGYKLPLDPSVATDIYNFVRMLGLQTSIYLRGRCAVGTGCGLACTKISMNGANANSTEVLAVSMHTNINTSHTFPFSLKKGCYAKSIKTYPIPADGWDMIVTMVVLNKGVRTPGDLSIVNGTLSVSSGPIEYIREMLMRPLIDRYNKESIDKKTKKTVTIATISNKVKFVLSAPIPGADWDSQKKEKIHLLNDTMKNYSMSAKDIDICTQILWKTLMESLRDKETTTVEVEHRCKPDKYIPARFAKVGSPCWLVVAEGDSAISFVKSGLSTHIRQKATRQSAATIPYTKKSDIQGVHGVLGGRDDYAAQCTQEDVLPRLEAPNVVTSPSFDWIGVISLQGVILNVMKQDKSDDKPDKPDGSKTPTPAPTPTPPAHTLTVSAAFAALTPLPPAANDKIKDNVVLQSLMTAWGLRFGKRYDTAEARRTLLYSHLLICTDQDVDGEGKIDPLVLTFIHKFWPELIEAGVILRFRTPIARIFDNRKKLIDEFSYQCDLDEWIKRTKDINKYTIKYYKGLGSHDPKEAVVMFGQDKFAGSVYTYRPSTLGEITTNKMDDTKAFDIYFGPDPEKRKKVLSTDAEPFTRDELSKIVKTKSISVGSHLRVDAGNYKRVAISRQLPHLIDGLNPVQRKILFAALTKIWPRGGKTEKKVQTMIGIVISEAGYHYGPSSVEKSMIHMGRKYPGSNQLPLLLGMGQFGDKHGNKPAAARYVSMKLSPITQLLFPIADAAELTYEMVDGKYVEPVHYIPILPLNILEKHQIPTEGWNAICFARCYKHVLQILMKILDGDEALLKIIDSEYFDERAARRTGKMPTLNINAINRYDLDSTSYFDTPRMAATEPNADTDLIEFGMQPTQAVQVMQPTQAVQVMQPTQAAQVMQPTQAAQAAPQRRSTNINLDVCKDGYTGKFMQYGEALHCFGICEYIENENKVIISELPIGVKSSSFVKEFGTGVEKGAHIKSVVSYSNDNNVHIEIVFSRPTSYKDIAALHADNRKMPNIQHAHLYEFFNLHRALKPNLNYYFEGRVVEFDDRYCDAMREWFKLRRCAYKSRILRQHIIIRLKIAETENIIQYIGSVGAKTINIAKKRDIADAVAELSANEFIRINSALLHKMHVRIKTTDINAFVTGIAHNEDDITYENQSRYLSGQVIGEAEMTDMDDMTGDDIEMADMAADGGEDDEDAAYTSATTQSANHSSNRSKITYDYLLNIRERDLIESNVAKKRVHLNKLRAELEAIEKDLLSEPFPGANVWKNELLKLDAIITREKPKNWS